MSNEIIEMALCETHFVVLKPNVLYRFTIRPGCDKCEQAARDALGED